VAPRRQQHRQSKSEQHRSAHSVDFVQTLNREALERDKSIPAFEGAIESFELAFRMQKDLPKLR